MLPVRQPSVCAAITPFLVACALVALLQTQARAEDAASVCEEFGLALLSTPVAPWKGAPLRVVVATEKPQDGALTLIAPSGKVVAQTSGRQGGPPYFWHAEVAAPEAGTWQAKLTRDGATPDCRDVTREIEVAAKRPRGPGGSKAVWPLRDSWDRANENLYSAWLQILFDAPLDEDLSWKALGEVLHDDSRNVLFNHLGLREDQTRATIRPDCADLPYFLRAYFAFKMGLPFGYAKCTRGDGGRPPRCPKWWNIVQEEPLPVGTAGGGSARSNSLFGSASRPAPVRYRVPARPKGLVPGFQHYLSRTVADGVHSGNGRTANDDDDTDFYPVPLTREALRPGTIYADPYGHILMLVKRVPQTDEGAGVFLAVDGQPDGTVARKRFWRGNFLFAQNPALGGPGFKRIRPIERNANGTLRRLTNAQIAEHPDYGDFSLQQSTIDVEAFYDRMDDVMSPAPLDPVKAMTEAVTALEEQVNARVTSVENGRKFLVGNRVTVAMPSGPSIFETSGAWENFATPSRDLRLLIAMDVVRKFPERVERRPERYAMPAGKSPGEVRKELEETLLSELSTRKFSYTRSDGSSWTLSLDDLLVRINDLEMAYNINDCAEMRWGALEGSEEAATCKRAPVAQRRKMASDYRPWFSERRRPPRG
ncbi:hypothetical protein AUC68_09705 [Methyloceanibacter methanicus]|uniref:Uncharacterized protein n=1 Tax=Methyloceanibacter methanicus TaxID=1774968 RepID=A0A1E3VYR1_9HYPH|nr:hypothetical protein [Methyloceanibacter methanicus]ODR98659.1 hypothetical protein AUC68_09705 [Methyloceanibacter methanicus]